MALKMEELTESDQLALEKWNRNTSNSNIIISVNDCVVGKTRPLFMNTKWHAFRPSEPVATTKLQQPHKPVSHGVLKEHNIFGKAKTQR